MMTLTIPASGPITFSDHPSIESEDHLRNALGFRHYQRTHSGWATPRRNASELLVRLVATFGPLELNEDGFRNPVDKDSVETYARDIRSNAQHRRERMQQRRKNAI